ncbi:MAG: hypothetical protein A2934_05930 [Candidatus Sungbacteria bacterium RIFCSPLOWO2_01_FULL_47_10]|uniref:Methyltransferase type 11 domain-containing protein n=1 Tax=Candidatus Sungbacteria bacterium RIFCSPLOWO2_01_FULL_47_10 TaxID=1802276 RepID=A0A1G2L0V1_9BACT|nr:MAG: hypothetical protein A2934_05930 [Candidatus Sungbacteria bacterium RIFCSPLOWO2_01_FULL_47_10]
MSEVQHFKQLNKYYNFSRWKYNWFLNGSRHFGFYPKKKWIPTEEAQTLMQNLVAEKVEAGSGKKLLDAGCGQGVTAIYLAKKYGSFVEGVTMVPYEVEEFTKIAKNFGVDAKAHATLMDYSHLKFGAEYFDGVYSQESLVHSINLEKTLRELYRVLKQGGRAAFFEYSMADDSKFSKEELKTLNEMNEASAMYSFPNMRHGAFSRLMQNIGFRNVEVEIISEEVGPMIKRYQLFAKPPYFLFKLFGLTKNMPNLVAAARMVRFGEKDLIRYNIFTAVK